MERIKLIAIATLAASGLTATAAQAAPTPYGRGIQSRPRVITVASTTTVPVVLSRPR